MTWIKNTSVFSTGVTLERNCGRIALAVCRVLAHLPIVSAPVHPHTELLFAFSGTRGKTLLENEFDYSSYKVSI